MGHKVNSEPRGEKDSGKESSEAAPRKDIFNENKFMVYKNELIHGVLDKAQFGNYGMVHMVQELYGSNTAGILLSALSRLFTAFLQVSVLDLYLSGVYIFVIISDDKGSTSEIFSSKIVEEKIRIFQSWSTLELM